MKRRLHSGDSLDLLLDTVCNTFGSLVFIALLLVILVHSSGATRQDHSSSSGLLAVEADSQIEQAVSRLKRLQDALNRQNRHVTESQSPEALELVRRARQAQERSDRLRSELAGSQSQLSSIRTQTEEVGDGDEQLRRRLDEATRRLADAERQLAAMVRQRTRSLTPAPLRTSNATRQHYMLIAGRLHGPVNDARGRNNEADFLFERGSIRPNPSGGLRVDAAGKNRALVVEKLRTSVEVGRINLWVAEDSFRFFDAVYVARTELGLKASVRFLDPDATLYRGGSGRHAEN